jgi:hypothetical protein
MNVEDDRKLKFIFCFTETTHEPLHLDEWYNKRLRTYLTVSLELLFCLTMLLNVVIVNNFKIVLGQKANNSV